MSKLIDAMRAKYKSPQQALKALGLDASLIEPRLACDEEINGFRQLLLSLRAHSSGTVTPYADRWPEWDRIKIL
jgi:hypothetical protein